MLRTALRPRWLALLVLVLVAASGMARLGQWQLDRARENGGQETKQELRRPAVPLGSVLTARRTFPGTAVDQPVTATGRWDAAHQLVVADRHANTKLNGGGEHGFWVLTPLLLADGSAIPVVRGWVKTAGDPSAATSAVPTGTVTVTGALKPSEPAEDRRPGESTGLPAGQIDVVDVTQLIKVWPYPLVTGYVVLTAQTPPGGPGRLVEVTSADASLALQNLSYAIQWFLFAGFGLFIWWRIVREDQRGTLGTRRPAPVGNDDVGNDDVGNDDVGNDDVGNDDPARTRPGTVGDDEAPTPAVGGSRS